MLKSNKNKDVQNIWSITSAKNVNLDALVTQHGDKQSALKTLAKEQQQEIKEHLASLQIQGQIINFITQTLSKTTIAWWASEIEKLPAPLFKFVKKAMQQQLPTASNLVRWGKTQDVRCPLCQEKQTNKHVLSNCSSSTALTRFKNRHDNVLSILVEGISRKLQNNQTVYSDLDGQQSKPVSELFMSLRPDIAIRSSSTIDTLELTICHETNLEHSKKYKEAKYVNLKENLSVLYSNYKLNKYTIEVTTLGLISDTTLFAKKNLTEQMPAYIKNQIAKSVISD